MLGLLIFAYLKNNLEIIIDDLTSHRTLDWIKFDLNQELEKYFILHNKQEKINKIKVDTLCNWQKMIEINFKYNYEKLRKNKFYN